MRQDLPSVIAVFCEGRKTGDWRTLKLFLSAPGKERSGEAGALPRVSGARLALPHAAASSFNARIAFSLRISGWTSGLKSRIQRSGAMSG